ncbi:hypothetical protein LTR49_008862 [Elasticomyces elasticus]|nr:hypothetical protein LTR49_008862 [Elasticomyces elasticus]
MVYTGKPSAGCENCRYDIHCRRPYLPREWKVRRSLDGWKSSLAAERGYRTPVADELRSDGFSKARAEAYFKPHRNMHLPGSSLYAHLLTNLDERKNDANKACQRVNGYRDLNDLMFRDQTSSVTRKASARSNTGTSSNSSEAGGSLLSRQPSLSTETVASAFFFEHFVTNTHLSFLEGFTPDDFLLKPIVAIGLAAIANRENDTNGQEIARRYYVEALAATNAALRHPIKVREDSTIMAVALLSCFERLNWDSSASSWEHHVAGATQVLQLRTRSQLRTTLGRKIFRELRSSITLNALLTETEVPDFIVDWSTSLAHDTTQTPSDQLSVLAARVASSKCSFLKMRIQDDQQLMEATSALERDLVKWSDEWPADDLPSTLCHAMVCIFLSRTQEAVLRRSWPALATIPPSPQHYRDVRNRMTDKICSAAVSVFAEDDTIASARKSIPVGLAFVAPLFLAATCLLEQLAEPLVSPGGSRTILIERPMHKDPLSFASLQLAGVIERLDLIDRIGVRWSGALSKILSGQVLTIYDLGRS